MKMSSEKQTSGSRASAKDGGLFRLLRARAGRRGALRTKDFWRALSTASFAPPQGTVPPRLHD